MRLFDVNVLVSAFREDSPMHPLFKKVLEESVNGPSPFGLSRTILSGFLRVSTHPRIFSPPTPLADALAFCDDLRTRSGFRWIEPGPAHWGIFSRLCRETNAVGNLVPDAWFAALAIESGSTWVTGDRDYGLFRGLERMFVGFEG
jgi:toxin-antitoxin system PIN domain toxin